LGIREPRIKDDERGDGSIEEVKELAVAR